MELRDEQATAIIADCDRVNHLVNQSIFPHIIISPYLKNNYHSCHLDNKITLLHLVKNYRLRLFYTLLSPDVMAIRGNDQIDRNNISQNIHPTTQVHLKQ